MFQLCVTMLKSASRSLRSGVWEHFQKVGGKENEVVCSICKKGLSYNGSTTSNLHAHLKKYHSSLLSTSGACTAKKPAAQAMMTDFAAKLGTKTCGSAQAESITNLLINWVTSNMRPLSILSDSGLQSLLRHLEPGYTIPSRTFVASAVAKRHEEGKAELRALLKSVPAVAVTTDAWTSKAVRSFATYTVHFLNNSWELQSFVLATRPMDGSHTAANIAEHIRSIADEYGIADKITAVVHDEAANMVVAGRLLDWSSEVCAAHRLQTCLRHAFDDSKPIKKLLAEARKVVAHFHHSCIATQHLLEKQKVHKPEGNPKKLVQDVPTRWNSSYYMLQRLVELKVSVSAVLTDPVLTPKSEHRALLLKEKRWALAEELVSALQLYEKATNVTVLSGQQYLTISSVLPITSSLVRCSEQQASADDFSACVKAFCAQLAEEVKQKFRLSPVRADSVSTIAAALYPRSRSLVFLEEDQREELRLEILRWCTPHCSEAEVAEGDSAASEPPAKRSSLDLDLFFGEASDTQVSGSAQAEKEVSTFFNENAAPSSTDPLRWWQTHESRFSLLSNVAKQVLCVPATSVPSERVFSAAGHIVSKLRAALSPGNIDALIFLQQNRLLRSTHGPEAGSFACHPKPLVALDEILDEEVEAAAAPPLPDLD